MTDLLAQVREAHALELDLEARCGVCGDLGRLHRDTGCDACECAVPLRLVRCVVLSDEPRYTLTAQAWRALEAQEGTP